MTHWKNLDKIAIVSSSKVRGWLVSMDALFALMVGIGEKHFETSDLPAAWEWVKEPKSKMGTWCQLPPRPTKR